MKERLDPVEEANYADWQAAVDSWGPKSPAAKVALEKMGNTEGLEGKEASLDIGQN